MSRLLDRVTVDRRYQRSARLDADVAAVSALDGYILQPTVAASLETLAGALAMGARAFTWTGPYGGGKSSAALLLKPNTTGAGSSLRPPMPMRLLRHCGGPTNSMIVTL